MKPLSNWSLPLVLGCYLLGSIPSGNARTMLDIPGVPATGLRAVLPAEAYSRLVNEPVKAWILVRGQVLNNKVAGARIAHSEANGVYDKVALQMAEHMTVYSDIVGSRVAATVLIHVLIYELPDKGEDALAIAQNDAVGTANLVYSRSLMMRHLGLANQQASASNKKKK
jgi:hypothetical protein